MDRPRYEMRAIIEQGFRRQTWALVGVLIPGFRALLAGVRAVANR